MIPSFISGLSFGDGFSAFEVSDSVWAEALSLRASGFGLEIKDGRSMQTGIYRVSM